MPNAWYALSVMPLAAGAFGPLPSGPALVIGGLIAAVGAAVQLSEAHERSVRRDTADEVIADALGERVPDSVVWRLEELGETQLRKRLAKSLFGILRDADGPSTAMVIPVARGAVRRNHAELASRLAAVDRPIDPRGVARLRLLLVRLSSPLYDPDAADALQREFIRARATLDPRRRP